jgi:diaminopimelate decarboxylase
MDEFRYTDGHLYCEQVKVEDIAAGVGTPAYIYSAGTVLSHYRRMAAAFGELKPTICFSIKSCQNLHICSMLAAQGCGFDVVSGGELYRALHVGADPSQIVYAGVGKTDREVGEAIEAGIGLFNIESEAELQNLANVAGGRSARVSAALRINPDVDPKTHAFTSTGKKETKFGVDLGKARELFKAWNGNRSVHLRAAHLHIGSPVYTIEPYVEAITKVLRLIHSLREEGVVIDALDIGGGFGADYGNRKSPSAEEYAGAIVPLLANENLKIYIEPGRSLIGTAGILLARVLYIKQTPSRRFVIVDAGMNDLIRPCLYGAYHFIWPARVGKEFVPGSRAEKLDMPGLAEVDVVGPVCESTDFLAQGRFLPPMNRDDLLAVFTAGAYGMVMSSQYNGRPRAAEVLVEGDRWRVIRRRETYEDLVRAEIEVDDLHLLSGKRFAPYLRGSTAL